MGAFTGGVLAGAYLAGPGIAGGQIAAGIGAIGSGIGAGLNALALAGPQATGAGLGISLMMQTPGTTVHEQGTVMVRANVANRGGPPPRAWADPKDWAPNTVDRTPSLASSLNNGTMGPAPLGPGKSISAIQICGPNADPKLACVPPGTTALDFVVVPGGVVVEGAGVTGRLLINLLRNLLPRALRGPIVVTEKGLTHVLARHIIGGAEVSAEKSVFAAGTNVPELVKAAETIAPVAQKGGNFARVVDAGRVIGTTFEGAATRTYTVITNAANELVTAFPGLPL